MSLRTAICIFVFGAALLFGAASANGKAFYVAGNSNRTTGGVSCADALSIAWFNNPASWGTASHQISAGTTVYLCGVFNGRPGEELLTLRGSGTSGSPITIKFMPGAVLSAPYWAVSGAIHADGLKYIVIDGGTNGVIQNTQNGTGRAYRQQSVAIHAAGCTGCKVQNLTIQNLYVRTSNSDYAPTHSVHCVYWHDANSFTVSHVTCHDAAWAITGEGNNFTLEYSNIYRVDHGVASGPATAMGGYRIHHNHFHDFANWDSPTDAYHHDGIHLWGQRGGAVTSGWIYNNTFDGDFGVNVTGHIYLQDSIRNVAVYNNVFSTPATRSIYALWFAAGSTSLPGGAASGNSAYNNSINAGAHHHGGAIYAQSQLQFTAVNNVLGGGLYDLVVGGGGTRSSTGVNHNIYMDLFSVFGDSNTFSFQAKSYHTLAEWQQACRCDSSSRLVSIVPAAAVMTAASAAQTVEVAAASSAMTLPIPETNMTEPLAAETAKSVRAESGTEVITENAAVEADASAPVAENVANTVAESATSDPVDTQSMDYLTTVGVGNGLNLSEIATGELAPLALDKNGKERPAAGPWNIGPY